MKANNIYLAWTYTRYEGPWGNLYHKLDEDAVIEWWDLPGISDSNMTRRLLSLHCARRLDVVLMVGHSRVPEAEDVTRLQPLLNRPLKQVPQILYIFNVGRLQLNDWFAKVKRAGSVRRYYETGAEGEVGLIGGTIAKEMATLLLKKQNAIEICPALTGNHRLAIFHRISETCTTVLFYGMDKWQQLQDAHLLDDLKTGSAPVYAGNKALLKQLRLCQRRRIHQEVLDPMNWLRSVFANARNILSQRRRMEGGDFSQQVARLNRGLQLLSFSPALPLEGVIEEVQPWLNSNEEEWMGEVRVMAALYRRHRLNDVEFVHQLVSFLMFHGVDEVGSPSSYGALQEFVKRMLQPVLRYCVRESCRATFLALHLLLYNRDQKVDREMLKAQEAEHASIIEEQLQLLEDSADGGATQPEDADDDEVDDTNQQLKKGRGPLSADEKEQLWSDLCRSAYTSSWQAAEESLDELSADQWMQKRLKKWLMSECENRKAKLLYCIQHTRDSSSGNASGPRSPTLEEAVVGLRDLLTKVVRDTLRELASVNRRGKRGKLLDSLVSGEQWEGQYQSVLTAATAHMKREAIKKLRKDMSRLEAEWDLSSSAGRTAVTTAEEPAFLQEAPRLLERKPVAVTSAIDIGEEAEADLLKPIRDAVPVSGTVMGPLLGLPRRWTSRSLPYSPPSRLR